MFVDILVVCVVQVSADILGVGGPVYIVSRLLEEPLKLIFLFTRASRTFNQEALLRDHFIVGKRGRVVTCCVPLLGGEDLLEGEDLLFGLLELSLPLLPLPLLLLRAQLLEVPANH